MEQWRDIYIYNIYHVYIHYIHIQYVEWLGSPGGPTLTAFGHGKARIMTIMAIPRHQSSGRTSPPARIGVKASCRGYNRPVSSRAAALLLCHFYMKASPPSSTGRHYLPAFCAASRDPLDLMLNSFRSSRGTLSIPFPSPRNSPYSRPSPQTLPSS